MVCLDGVPLNNSMIYEGEWALFVAASPKQGFSNVFFLKEPW